MILMETFHLDLARTPSATPVNKTVVCARKQ
jgi:hypothetical protein